MSNITNFIQVYFGLDAQLNFNAATCFSCKLQPYNRGTLKPVVQLVGDKLVCLRQLHRKCTILSYQLPFSLSFLFQPIYDTLFLTFYNILFTSLPILIFGLFEQNLAAQTLLEYPQLYGNNRRNVLMSWSAFLQWITFGESWKEWITAMKTALMFVCSPVIFNLSLDNSSVIVFTLCQKNKSLFHSHYL